MQQRPDPLTSNCRERVGHVVPPDAPLFRYMALDRLLGMLANKSLWLCRIGCLESEDWCEGQIPPIQQALLDHQSGDGFGSLISQGSRRCNFVSSWCMSQTESHAMWRIYAPSGVAIQSSVSRLQPLLTKESVDVRGVQYIDDDREFIPPATIPNPAFWKRGHFRYESEVRLCKTDLNYLQDPSPPPGINVPFEFDAFVECVIVSPHVPNWTLSAIVSMIQQFGSKVPVSRSRMLKL